MRKVSVRLERKEIDIGPEGDTKSGKRGYIIPERGPSQVL